MINGSKPTGAGKRWSYQMQASAGYSAEAGSCQPLGTDDFDPGGHVPRGRLQGWALKSLGLIPDVSERVIRYSLWATH